VAACFIVRDANGRALAYVYFEEEPGRRGGSPTHAQRGTGLAAMRRAAQLPRFDRLRKALAREPIQEQAKTDVASTPRVLR
jgi:hypothetical protein